MNILGCNKIKENPTNRSKQKKIKQMNWMDDTDQTCRQVTSGKNCNKLISYNKSNGKKKHTDQNKVKNQPMNWIKTKRIIILQSYKVITSCKIATNITATIF